MDKKIELLAPAKDKKCAFAAINCGADAIYIGATKFGARKNASNSISDIKEIVDYAHKVNVKVYATINTILKDDEINKAKNLIISLKEIGIDALIIQDMGLLDFIKEIKFEVHASTQCDNRTLEKVQFLEKAGFFRVILARELSLEQIREIKQNTNVELEVFIHGALCVSYSGQCYLSQLIGGRSANKGECAQPCRKKYSLVDENGSYIAKDKYLLSLMDFNASKHIKELAEIGVTSFKIEGRLKDEKYVKNVVAYYRKLIDNLGLKKSSAGEVSFDFEPSLEKSFNRGFSDYFLNGKRKEIYCFDSPKSTGEYIGKVLKVGRDFFEINAELNPQDGLCFMENGTLSGCLVNKTDKGKIYPNKMSGIKVGTQIYRNFDSEFEKRLKNSKTIRKIILDIEFGLQKIRAIDEEGYSAEIKYSFDEFAQNPQKMAENIISQFKKSGDSEFLAANVNINGEKIPFLPVSKLNELRRELFDKQREIRFKALFSVEKSREMKTSFNQQKSCSKDYNKEKLDYKANILNDSARKFYEDLGFEVIENALESLSLSSAGKTAMTCKHCLKHAFNICKSPKKLFLIDEKNKRYELRFNCEKCEMEIIF